MYETLEHWKQYKQEKAKVKFNTNHMLIDNSSKDNSSKLVSDYDKKEFDEWIDDLGKKNGYTLYQKL